MHLSLKSSLGRQILTGIYVKDNRVLDLTTPFSELTFTLEDKSGEGNDATLYSGRYISTDGSTDRGIVADCSAAGAGNYYLTGKVRPNAVTTAELTMDGSTDSGLTGLTADVWQTFTTATSAVTPSAVQVGYDGSTASAADWSDVRLIDSSDGSTVARWQLNESADGDLNGYPALDSSGNGYHGTHTGCAGGTGEAGILQTAGMDWNKDSTTYAGKTILVPERDALDGFDALGNAIAEPRPTADTWNMFGDGEYGRVADADSLDVTTAATWEIWGNFYASPPTDNGIFSRYEAGDRSWLFLKNDTTPDGEITIFLSANGTINSLIASVDISDAMSCLSFVYGGATLKAYENGAEITVNITSGAVPAAIHVPSSGIYIGAWGGAAFTDKQISRPKIYNSALTADEVLQNYQAQKSSFGL